MCCGLSSVFGLVSFEREAREERFVAMPRSAAHTFTVQLRSVTHTGGHQRGETPDHRLSVQHHEKERTDSDLHPDCLDLCNCSRRALSVSVQRSSVLPSCALSIWTLLTPLF